MTASRFHQGAAGDQRITGTNQNAQQGAKEAEKSPSRRSPFPAKAS